MTGAPGTPRRLLIGAGSFADARAALRLAERLAEITAGDLGGLLVEETIVAEIVERPGQRVVTPGGSIVVAPSRHQVRTMLEGDARAFREMLARLARAKTRNWSFERRQGDLIGRLCEAAQSWDLLLLGHREIHRRAGRVVLIAPPGLAGQPAVALARQVAGALGCDVVQVALGTPPKDRPSASGDPQWFPTESELLARISRMNAAAVVLDLQAGPFHSHDQLRQLLAAARCPVLVLGAGQGTPSIPLTTQIPPAPR